MIIGLPTRMKQKHHSLNGLKPGITGNEDTQLWAIKQRKNLINDNQRITA